MPAASALKVGNLFKNLPEDDLLAFFRDMRRDMIDFAETPEGKVKMEAWKEPSKKGERT